MLKKVIFVIVFVIFIDQFIKIWVKTHFSLGEEVSVFGDWFILHFTENPGMAFGMSFGGNTGKLILSIFRLFAVVGICWWIRSLILNKANPKFIIALSFIFAGALGNIIDSLFYGMLFNTSKYQIATFLPDGGGYAPFLFGKVVDMIYFPLIHGNFPSWMPFWGGQDFMFFRPVFNIADTSISVGVGLIILRQLRIKKTESENAKIAENHNVPDSNTDIV